jgi:hypothetical protein
LENFTYLHAGARICHLFVSERERENKGLGAWFFFLKNTNLLKDRAKGREEWRIFSKTIVILECINLEHRRCRAFITFVIKDKVLVLQLTTLSGLAMELRPQPVLTIRPQGRTMAEIHR